MGDAVDEEPVQPSSLITAALRGEYEAMLTIVGDLDEAAIARLGHIVLGLVTAGARYLVVDFTDVTACEPAARQLFARLQRRLQLSQGWMLLLDPPAVLADLGPVSLEAAFAAYRRAAARQPSPPPAPEVA